jgi:uncharacterized protein (TIGR00290 family)
LHLAEESGLRITTLVSMFEEEEDRSRSHALPSRLLRVQADQMGLALISPRASWANYESVFVSTLKMCGENGIGDAVFGDIDLVPHRQWEEKVCAQASMTAHLPLWDWPRQKVVDAVFGAGIQAICVCVNTRFLPKEFCGRHYDRQFISDLPAGVDACGENGEFHTFVTSARRFKNPIRVRVAQLRQYIGPTEFGGDEFWFAELDGAS